ncbi:GFA family protein [Vannielia sp. SX4]|uniref:GFA family protein n=1 Tax=Vannielia sp. SX4 TaxID=3463852 RepID=UPI0040595C9D
MSNDQVDWTGGCFCGALRYRVTAEPVLRAQCHCRACTHISGGGVNTFMLIPPGGFAWEVGEPARFQHPESQRAVERFFCATCGTHIFTQRGGLEGVVLKVGTLDAPEVFGGPRIAIFCEEGQAWHHVPEGVAAFDRLPPG